jgi:hypothetical protein
MKFNTLPQAPRVPGMPGPIVPNPRPVKKPVVLFAIPGGSFTQGFFDSWTRLLMASAQLPFDLVCTRHYSPVIYHCRANLLGADNRAGLHQLPFQGRLNYDYMMWLDTDINFTVEQILSLFTTMQKQKDIEVLCGIYLTTDGVHSTIVKDWDVNYFLKTGMFPFLTIDQLKEEAAKSPRKLAKVFYAGMGCMMVRKGAFEKITYPWFEPVMHEIEQSRDFSSEDVSLCWKWAEKEVGIWVDPNIVVGHEKQVVIR